MAFNFNWSPLAADGEFYRRCRDLLTAALNKSPKPPIIVDDIFVTEFNLGSVPPDLEILEIGDLAEDRFRGIFKMCYGGDAFLTLKTRVQANPLNTYLDSKPSFTSPKPLAAASGLTIPLSITLSEIKLSAFIILVFSKQKGLTLVFRNDPLESLKVSSTFDSIQFVRDYLQRTIEGQLRNLMMNELPAIIHRLSLQFWCPDQASARNGEEDELAEKDSDEPAVDPLASPPLDPVDANGNVLDEAEVSRLSLDGGREVQLTFAQKNVLFGSSLSELNRTLQMRRPSMREVVFRGWAGDAAATGTSTPGGQLRSPSVNPSSSTTYTFSDYGSATTGGYLPSRSSLVSLQSAAAGLSVGAGGRTRSYAGRKKKTRIVNLRKSNSDSGDKEPVAASVPPEPSSPSSSSDVDNEPVRPPPLKSVLVPAIPEDQEEEVFVDARTSPPRSQADPDSPKSPGLGIDGFDSALPTSKQQPPQKASYPPRLVGTATASDGALFGSKEKSPPLPLMGGPLLSARRHHHMEARSDPAAMPDQQWIMKMAGEIARRVYDEKRRQQQEAGAGPWDERDDAPPPAYEAAR